MHRGQPAGQPHGAVRGQGHRRAAGQGGGPGDGRAPRWPSCGPRACCAAPVRRRPRGGQGGGAALRPLPRGRHRARARRCARPARSWASTSPSAWPSPRARLAAGNRAARRAARCSCRWPTGTSRPGVEAARSFGELGLRHRRPPSGTADYLEPARRRRSPRVVAKVGEQDGHRRRRADRRRARSQLVVNTPRGPRPAGRRRPHPRGRRRPPGAAASPPSAAALAAADGMADCGRHPLRGAVAAGVPPRRRTATS